MPKLTVDREAHVYRYGGVRAPSVTDVIAHAGVIDTQWFTEESRQRGTDVHTLAAALDRGTLDPADVPEVYRGYIESYRRAVDYYAFEWSAVELAMIFDATGAGPVAGRVDRVGRSNLRMVAGRVQRVPRGTPQRCVADLKTGPPLRWHGVQLAGYDVLKTGHWAGHPSTIRVGIYLQRSGDRAQIVIFDDMRDYADFARYSQERPTP